MSPLIYSLPSKHGRRLMSPPHVPYVEVRNLRRRTDTSHVSKESFDGIINRWWAAFAIGGLVLIMLLVIAVVGVARCLKRRKAKHLAPESEINGKESRNEKATAPGFGSFLFGSPPHIMITPATASPPKLRFSLETDETLVDLACYPKCGDKFTDPELGLDFHQREYRENSDSLGLPPYHLSHIRGRNGEDEMLDGTDPQSPSETSPAPPPAPANKQLNPESDPDTVSGNGANELELTEAELRTLMLQFPPPAYPKASNPMHQTREKTLPLRLENEPHNDPYTRYAVRQFAFHQPAVWQRRPGFPGSSTSAVDIHTTPVLTTREPRSKSSPTTSQSAQTRADRYKERTYL